MTSSTPARHHGEILIQDLFQRQVEAGLAHGLVEQKVLLWSQPAHKALRNDPLRGQARPLVVMGSVERTSDRSYGADRKDIRVDVFGLVDAMERVNASAFEHWLAEVNPGGANPALTVRSLAQAAASHLADLYEACHHGERTGIWRLLLAFGEAHAWERTCGLFGLKKDPRALQASEIPGAPADAPQLPYAPCWPANQTAPSFLDLEPDWLDALVGPEKLDCMAEAARRVRAALSLLGEDAPIVGTDRRNRHFWVRECPIGPEGRQERPDFVLFVHGLPILWVELKTPEATLESAIRDFQTKPSYQGAPVRLAANGRHSVLFSSLSGKLETWACYEGNLGDRDYFGAKTPPGETPDPLDSQAWLVEQLLSRPARLEFYLLRCSSVDKSGKFLLGRSQQYQALAHWGRDLEWLEICQSVKAAKGLPPVQMGNRLIRHTQRTGKTKTMARAIHLALARHGSLYRLAVLMVGEVQILQQILDEMKENNLGLVDVPLNLFRAESRNQLATALAQEKNQSSFTLRTVILANMQKISLATDADTTPLPDSEKVLVVLDEGHLAQTGNTAKARAEIFPAATHLLLTATPKNTMTDHYGISASWNVLDDFGYGVAKTANIVCPVVYKRHPYRFQDDPEKIAQLAKVLRGFSSKDIGDVGQIIRTLDSDEEDAADDELGESSRRGGLARAVRRELEKDLMAERLSSIVHELDEYESGLERRADGTPLFPPRALVFDRDTDSAVRVIEFIQSQHSANARPSHRNVFHGRRFAIDVADFGKDPDGKERSFQSLNPGVATHADLLNRFASDDPEQRIDVLLAVGKYTKGYDNDQLALVALLRNVVEPSLINQIYTRPATRREGKAKGVCLDLAFGLGNLMCWQESLKLYDRQVDLENLYTQEQAQGLVDEVRHALDRAAGVAGTDLDGLSNGLGVIAILDPDRNQKKAQGFILAARQVTRLVAKLPDSSVFRELQRPLRGLRVTLTGLRELYPGLFLDDSVAADGTVDAGLGPRTLGEMLREALAVLGQSSLKALLGVDLDLAREIAPETGRPELTSAREKQSLLSAQSALEAILGKGAKKPPLARKGATGLLDLLNRALDRLRDELDGRVCGRAPSVRVPTPLDDAKHAIEVWLSEAASHGGSLRIFLRESLERLVMERALALGLDEASAGLNEGQVVGVVLDFASEQVSTQFAQWRQSLHAGWRDREPEFLAQAWLTQRQDGQSGALLNFLVPLRARQDLHQKTSTEWMREITAIPQIAVLLGRADSDERLVGLPPLLDKAIELALQRQSAVDQAQAWLRSSKTPGHSSPTPFAPLLEQR